MVELAARLAFDRGDMSTNSDATRASSPISRCARRRTRPSRPRRSRSSESSARARSLPRACSACIGAPWLWFSRLVIDDAHLAAIIQHPEGRALLRLDEAGREVGMLELDFREPHECELAFIGLVPELSGKGHGRWLLAEAVTAPGATASSASTSTPARSTIRRRSPPIAAPASRPTSARSSASPTRACSASCRGTARLRSRCSGRWPEPRALPASCT